MNIINKIFLTALSTSLIGGSAHASFEKDVAAKMTQLLSHEPAVMNVFEAEKAGLNHARTKFQPWTGSYWPDITGNIAAHYRDHSKANAQITMVLNYSAGRRMYRGDFNDVKNNFSTWEKDVFNQKLSPSEKYDLLLGDANFTLSNSVMDEIDFRATHKLISVKTDGTQVDESAAYEGDGSAFSAEIENETSLKFPKIFKWMTKGKMLALWSGICDGWAPASIYLPRPVKPVTLIGALGHVITFYPEDLKALGSYLFARTNTPYLATMNYQYAGRRCDQKKKPDRDGGTGMVDDMRCNDLDASVWHATLLNRIGKDRIGFVMDVDNNVKVNNHAVHKYDLTYFSPETGKEGTLKQSMVFKGLVGFDGYAARRNPKTVYIVGVKSTVEFMNYAWSEERRNTEYDSAGEDKLKQIEYVYDLELDEKGNILGGEWGDRRSDRPVLGKVRYSEQPDFVWMGAPNILPYSEMSLWVSPGEKVDEKNPRPFGNTTWAFDGKKIPSDWVTAAKKDAEWKPPVVDNGSNTTEAVGSILKSAQPFSHLVYYLFDQARSKNEN